MRIIIDLFSLNFEIQDQSIILFLLKILNRNLHWNELNRFYIEVSCYKFFLILVLTEDRHLVNSVNLGVNRLDFAFIERDFQIVLLLGKGLEKGKLYRILKIL